MRVSKASEKFKLSDIKGKLALFDEDFPEGGALPEEEIKKLTRTTVVMTEKKFKDEKPTKTSVTFILASNDWPTYSKRAGPILRRAQIFELDNPITYEELIPEVEYLAAMEKDKPNICARWAFAYIDAINRGDKIIPNAIDVVAASRDKWQIKMNKVFAWFFDTCKLSKGREYIVDDLYEQFVQWYEKRSPGKSRYMQPLDKFVEILAQITGVTVVQKMDKDNGDVFTVVCGLTCRMPVKITERKLVPVDEERRAALTGNRTTETVGAADNPFDGVGDDGENVLRK